MRLPTVPTDNLYKFAAIFGLTLIVLSFYLMNQTYNSLTSKANELEVQDMIHQIKTDVDSTSVDLKIEKIKHDKEVFQLMEKVDKYPKAIYLNLLILMVGVIMSFWGFIQWYYKTQKKQDEILENEKTKLLNNKMVFVHSIQFEKEFAVYQELWPALINLRNETYNLRPIFDTHSADETEQDIKNRKWSAFKNAFTGTLNIFEHNKPFYPDDIYNEIDKIIRTSRKESVEFEYMPSSELEYYKHGEKNMDEIISRIDIICDKIRHRIGILKIENDRL